MNGSAALTETSMITTVFAFFAGTEITLLIGPKFMVNLNAHIPSIRVQ